MIADVILGFLFQKNKLKLIKKIMYTNNKTLETTDAT
jgi:hypothetical protein